MKLIGDNDEDEIKKQVSGHIRSIIEKSCFGSKGNKSDYAIVYLYRDSGYIDNLDANNLYRALQSQKGKDIFFILNSTGGQIEPAYLISKFCQEYKKDNFVIAVPRLAKSAATLIALGADKIHMGSFSQLGPIDPQINNLPVLSLNSALECIAKLSEKYPKSSTMFAEYLAKMLPLNILGHFERLPESAKDYAVRLLSNKSNPFSNDKIEEIATAFVYNYKDHSFVIDKDEAKKLLGEETIEINTDEYEVADHIYMFLDSINLIFQHLKLKRFNLTGTVEDLTTYSIEK